MNWVRIGFVLFLPEMVKNDVTPYFNNIYINLGVFKIGFVFFGLGGEKWCFRRPKVLKIGKSGVKLCEKL